jgi:hypothetical protein
MRSIAVRSFRGESGIGRPSFGAWVIYGLGSANANLPTFAVLAPPALAQPKTDYTRTEDVIYARKFGLAMERATAL